MTAVGTAGLCLLDSVELDELRFPMRIYRQEIAVDSEGPGRRRGAPGGHVEFGPTGGEMTVAYASDGTVNPAQGARGGGAGGRARQHKRDAGGHEHELESCAEVRLAPGEILVSITQVGGGYGPAFQRETERVQKHVAEGWITIGRARDVYGVIFDDDGKVDLAATESLRRCAPAPV